ncbi:M48 family metalloprotease [Candidatus Dependentiae bacterium]|nr:M48 family metalloprotease [Candidatus Dependentiae bacterium]
MFIFSSIQSGMMTAIQWLIGNGKPALDAIDGASDLISYKLYKEPASVNFLVPKDLRHLIPGPVEAPIKVQQYVRNELKSVLKDIDLKIYINERLEPWNASTNCFEIIHLGIDPKTKKTLLEELLSKDSLTIDEENKLKVIRFVLNHEASHIKNNDVLFLTLANIIIPTITWQGFKKLQLLMNQYLPSMLNTSLKIPSAIGLCIINILLFQAYKRYREQKADNTVINDPEILKGGIELMKDQIQVRDKRINFIKDFAKDVKISPKVANLIVNLILLNLHGTHPTYEYRQAKLEKRLKEIKQSFFIVI